MAMGKKCIIIINALYKNIVKTNSSSSSYRNFDLSASKRAWVIASLACTMYFLCMVTVYVCYLLIYLIMYICC